MDGVDIFLRKVNAIHTSFFKRRFKPFDVILPVHASYLSSLALARLISGKVPNARSFSFPLNLYLNLDHLPPLGWNDEKSPFSSESFQGLSEGLAP